MNTSTYCIGMTYTQSDAHTLHATVVCNTARRLDEVLGSLLAPTT